MARVATKGSAATILPLKPKDFSSALKAPRGSSKTRDSGTSEFVTKLALGAKTMCWEVKTFPNVSDRRQRRTMVPFSRSKRKSRII